MLGFLKKLVGPVVDFKALKERGAIILDVRTPGEFANGHIPGSMNVAVDQVSSIVQELKAKGKPVITCCRSGMRSSVAARTLKAAGIETYNGGAWNVLQEKLQ